MEVQQSSIKGHTMLLVFVRVHWSSNQNSLSRTIQIRFSKYTDSNGKIILLMHRTYTNDVCLIKEIDATLRRDFTRWRRVGCRMDRTRQ